MVNNSHIHNTTKRSSLKLERILAVLAVIALIIIQIAGSTRSETDIQPLLRQAMPAADRFEFVAGKTYAAYQTQSPEQLIGYVTTGTADGYGGPMDVLVAVDMQGTVVGVHISDQKETPAWMRRVITSEFTEDLLEKSYIDPFILGTDVDGITGATYTSRAIAEAVRNGSRTVAQTELSLNPPIQSAPPIQFGIPEITIIVLYIIGYAGHQRKFKYKKQVRWLSMLTGLVVLGFIYNQPLTLAFINKLLMGFWPQWQTHLYWYLLLGGILFVFTIENKNPYCEWFCPFGAAQECMGAIGGAKASSPRRYRTLLTWVQRGLAWTAIALALWFRSPGISSYEIFGTLFDLVGSAFQFILLGLVLIAALFIKRPWCRYLCPLHPVVEMIRLIRNWLKEGVNALWGRINPKSTI